MIWGSAVHVLPAHRGEPRWQGLPGAAIFAAATIAAIPLNEIRMLHLE